MKCFDDLIFDPANNMCEQESKIEICRSGLRDSPKIIKVYGHFSCDGKSQGLYFLACNGAYAYCDVLGNRRDRKCPPGTALDEKRQACDWTENIPTCNGKVPPPPLSSIEEHDDSDSKQSGEKEPDKHEEEKGQKHDDENFDFIFN